MSKNKKLIIGIIGIVAVILILFAVYSKFKPAAEEGTKAYTLEVVDNNAETKTYEGKTDAEFLKDLMDELSDKGDFSYDGEEVEYGLYINTVNGLTADFDTDGAYWAIYVNGEYGMYGADSQPVEDGSTYRLAYEKG